MERKGISYETLRYRICISVLSRRDFGYPNSRLVLRGMIKELKSLYSLYRRLFFHLQTSRVCHWQMRSSWSVEMLRNYSAAHPAIAGWSSQIEIKSLGTFFQNLLHQSIVKLMDQRRYSGQIFISFFFFFFSKEGTAAQMWPVLFFSSRIQLKRMEVFIKMDG